MNYISFSYNNKSSVFIWKVHSDHIHKGSEIIDDGNELRLMINFPLNLPKLFIFHKDDQKGWTRGEVLNIISRTYKQIYKDELSTSTINDNKSITDTRPETNGVHGLHTYYLTELFITEMIYDFKKDYWLVCLSGVHCG